MSGPVVFEWWFWPLAVVILLAVRVLAYYFGRAK
jgi:hypothetical protein